VHDCSCYSVDSCKHRMLLYVRCYYEVNLHSDQVSVGGCNSVGRVPLVTLPPASRRTLLCFHSGGNLLHQTPSLCPITQMCVPAMSSAVTRLQATHCIPCTFEAVQKLTMSVSSCWILTALRVVVQQLRAWWCKKEAVCSADINNTHYNNCIQ
jgi:hypothetical protein